VRLLMARGVRPNTVSALGLLPAAGAGVAAALGWFGLACMLATSAALGEIMNGLLARELHLRGGSGPESASDADSGEVLDAAIDRYSEFFFLAGVVIHFRANPLLMCAALLAMHGAFMVSYAIAKAEGMGVVPPRGVMRRPERAAYLFVGAVLASITQNVWAQSPSLLLRELPMVVAVTVVAVVANLSVVQRLKVIMKALARRPGPAAAGGQEAVGAPVRVEDPPPPPEAPAGEGAAANPNPAEAH
jgi:CDP-diacylglycerol--glycerol-3-phosphate 3-phosphatidyltransferase